MDWHDIQDRELAFLQDEKRAVQHKIERQRHGLHLHNGCDDCCAAEWDLDLLESIIAAQQSPQALSLESTLVCKLAEMDRQIAAISWRRGEPSPPEYWQLECQRDYVAELLNRYHAFRRNGAKADS